MATGGKEKKTFQAARKSTAKSSKTSLAASSPNLLEREGSVGNKEVKAIVTAVDIESEFLTLATTCDTSSSSSSSSSSSCKACGCRTDKFQYLQPWLETATWTPPITRTKMAWYDNLMRKMTNVKYARSIKRAHGTCVQGTHYGFTHTDSLAHALDFALWVGTPVVAARGGVVVDLVSHFRKGGIKINLKRKANYVIIRHDAVTFCRACARNSRVDTSAVCGCNRGAPSYSRYFHLAPHSVVVVEGQRVEQGDVLGLSGASGFAAGPHLHFDVVDVLSTDICSLTFRSTNGNGTFKKMNPLSEIKCTVGAFCSPPPLSRIFDGGIRDGITVWPSTQCRLVVANPIDLTTPIGRVTTKEAASMEPVVLLCERGNCDFVLKLQHAEKAGASGLIVFDNELRMGSSLSAIGSYDHKHQRGTAHIPVVFVSRTDGQKLSSILSAGGGKTRAKGKLRRENNLFVSFIASPYFQQTGTNKPALVSHTTKPTTVSSMYSQTIPVKVRHHSRS